MNEWVKMTPAERQAALATQPTEMLAKERTVSTCDALPVSEQTTVEWVRKIFGLERKNNES